MTSVIGSSVSRTAAPRMTDAKAVDVARSPVTPVRRDTETSRTGPTGAYRAAALGRRRHRRFSAIIVSRSAIRVRSWSVGSSDCRCLGPIGAPTRATTKMNAGGASGDAGQERRSPHRPRTRARISRSVATSASRAIVAYIPLPATPAAAPAQLVRQQECRGPEEILEHDTSDSREHGQLTKKTGTARGRLAQLGVVLGQGTKAVGAISNAGRVAEPAPRCRRRAQAQEKAHGPQRQQATHRESGRLAGRAHAACQGVGGNRRQDADQPCEGSVTTSTSWSRITAQPQRLFGGRVQALVRPFARAPHSAPTAAAGP